MTVLRILVLFCGLLSFVVPGRTASLIDDFSGATNDRFAGSSSFILNGVDLSGVGVDSTGKWGTLISPNVIISARHFHPGTSSQITFYQTNDPGGAQATRTVIQGQRVASSDIWVSALDAPLPGAYAAYARSSLALSTVAEFQSSIYSGAVGYMFGRSPTATNYGGGVATDQAVGQNILDLWFDDVDDGIGTVDDAVGAIRNQSTDPDYLTHETYLQGGDSGGPLFTLVSGQPHLVGINWFIDDGEPLGSQFSGFSYVGNYHSELQSFIQAHAIPEPAAILLMAGSLALLALLRRR